MSDTTSLWPPPERGTGWKPAIVDALEAGTYEGFARCMRIVWEHAPEELEQPADSKNFEYYRAHNLQAETLAHKRWFANELRTYLFELEAQHAAR